MQIVKEFFKAKAFLFAIIILLIYAIFYHNQIILSDNNLRDIFTFFLSLFLLIIAIFTILISFIDNDFLRFLKSAKTIDKKNNLYDEIITYFIINTILSLSAVILSGFILCFRLYNYTINQYVMIFLFTYTLISFIQLIRFIFTFAKQKAQFIEILDEKQV